MAHPRLERWQVLIYLAAIAAGAALGLSWPAAGAHLGPLVWPLLGLLLFATFLQLAPGAIREALGHRRFLVALLAGNFLAVPLLVWGLSWLLPDDGAIRLAFFLVLLAPCTDWFNTFSYLGRGDARLSAAATPLLLLAQMLLLPLLLILFLGPGVIEGMRTGPFLQALFGIILAPLALALVVGALGRRRPRLGAAVSRSGWLPIPLLALVLLVIAASEARAVAGAAGELLGVAALFVAYLLAVPLIAAAVGRVARLEPPAARTVLFSLGTRNSFVILPLVLAWPGAGEVAVAVVVLQSAVELSGMVAYVGLAPRWPRKKGAGVSPAPLDRAASRRTDDRFRY